MPRIDVVPQELSTVCDQNLRMDNYSSKKCVTRKVIKLEVLAELREHFCQLETSTKQSTKRKLGDMLFYQLVQGGSVDLVSEILDHVRFNANCSNFYEYLITGRRETGVKTEQHAIAKGMTSLFVRNLLATLVYWFLLIPLFLLTTPFFYSWHTATLWYMQRRSPFKTIKLPFLFCVFSSNVKMINVFREHNKAVLRCVDDDGNNVFHYLAMISRKHHQRSINYFKMLLKVFGAATTRDVLTECKNHNGLTALELAVMKGSPLYFMHLLETDGILKHTALQISDDMFQRQGRSTLEYCEVNTHRKSQSISNMQQDERETSSACSPTNDNSKSYRLDYYDVTKYERDDIVGESSFLLYLLAYRNLTKMADNEVKAIVNCRLLTHWLRYKVKCMFSTRVIQALMTYFLQAFLLQYLVIVNILLPNERLVIYIWDSVYQAASQNNKTQYLSTYSSASHSMFEFMQAEILQINAACGFDVSQLLSPNGNATNAVSQSNFALIYSELIFARTILLLSGGIILIDIFTRSSFLTRCYFTPGWSTRVLSVGDMCRPIFSRPIQVSYTGRLISVSSSCFMLAMIYFMDLSNSIVAFDYASANRKSFYLTAALVFAVVGSCLRFIQLLYALRASTVGHLSSEFNLTLCKLFKFVAEFALIYVGCSAFFATLFLLVVQDPACPSKSLYPFDTWPNSMIGIFKLMMGENMLPEVMSWELLSTYLIYVILTTIILLSMVTGISGSIADRVLGRDLIGILTKVESLQEAIKAESTLYACCSFVFKYFHKSRLLKSSNVVVELDKNSAISKVAIKVETLVDK